MLRQGTTPINDLLDLDADFGVGEYRLDNIPRRGGGMPMEMQRNDVQRTMDRELEGPSMPETAKYIRGSYHMNPESGMTNRPNMPMNRPMNRPMNINPINPMRENMMPPEEIEEEILLPQQKRKHENYRENFSSENKDPLSYNCVDIAKHIQNCPICSRFYNNDHTAYIIAIVVLAIVCLLLLKRVLNV